MIKIMDYLSTFWHTIKKHPERHQLLFPIACGWLVVNYLLYNIFDLPYVGEAGSGSKSNCFPANTKPC